MVVCFMLVTIEPLLLFVRLRETITENREKVNRIVVQVLGVTQ